VAAIDHLVFVSPDLDAGVAHLTELTGVAPVFGGAHPGRGTHNALLAFDDETYFEVIGIDPNQPPPTGIRPFGLTESAPMHLATFAVHPGPDESIDDVVALLCDAGFDPGPVLSMSRTRPDGMELHWRLTIAGDSSHHGTIPFVIDWGDAMPSPASSLPRMGSLADLLIGHPDRRVCGLVETLDPRITATPGPQLLEATVATELGRVVIT